METVLYKLHELVRQIGANGDQLVAEMVIATLLMYGHRLIRLLQDHEAKHVRQARRPPSSWLIAAVDLICSKATAESFTQAVADMRTEYFDALGAKRPNKAMWILVRSYVAIIRAFVVTKPLAAAIEFVVGIVLKAGK